jgi:hypothetical protein
VRGRREWLCLPAGFLYGPCAGPAVKEEEGRECLCRFVSVCCWILRCTCRLSCAAVVARVNVVRSARACVKITRD